VGPRSGLDDTERRKILLLYGRQLRPLGLAALQPSAIPTALPRLLQDCELHLQVLLSCVCCVVGISYGMSTGHSAVLLPHLQAENSSLSIDTDTGSWIGKPRSLPTFRKNVLSPSSG
jgi:hypothetical protein